MSILQLSKEFCKKKWLLLLFTFLFSCTGFILELIVLPLFTSKITTFSNDIIKVKKYIIKLFCVWVLIQLCFSVSDKLYEMVDFTCKQFVSETLLSYAIIRMDQEPDTINIAQLYNTIEKVEAHMTSMFYYMIRILPRIVSTICSIIILFTLQISAGLITLIGYLIILCIVIFFIVISNPTENTEEQKEVLLDKMNEEFANTSMIRSTATAIPLEIKDIQKITSNQYIIDIHLSNTLRKKQVLLYGCIISMSALLLYISYRNYKNNGLSTESFTRIILSIIPLCSQINDVIWYLPDLSKSIEILKYHSSFIKTLYSYSIVPSIPIPSSCSYSFTNVTFSYPDQPPLLHNFSMILPTGLIWLRGESGSGKSTFIKLLLGTLSVQEGTIHLGDTNVTTTIRHHIMYIHQHAISLFSTTIYENIMYGITEKKQYLTRLQELIKRYDLYSLFGCKKGDESFLYNHVGKLGDQLSGGQRQMVHLLRCMMIEKSLYIMDEPLTGLDPVTKSIVIQLLTDMITLGKTIYIISHDTLSFPEQHIIEFVKGSVPRLL